MKWDLNPRFSEGVDRPSYVAWCLHQWARIKLGGVWIVPRSGLSFTKTAEGFTLTDVARPVNAEFRAYQRSDFECIARHFAEAGLKVTDSREVQS